MIPIEGWKGKKIENNWKLTTIQGSEAIDDWQKLEIEGNWR